MSDHAWFVESSTNKASHKENASPPAWDIERRADGTLIVRMHSVDRCGRPLPDAVFTFRKGDPQYEHWAKQANHSQSDRNN